MGSDGWLAVGWPKAYGGQGYSGTEQLIFFEEANIAGAPLPFVTISTVGPALMEHGTELQKERFLPGIASGEIHFAIGYSEPDAGSDLATLKTSARLEGDALRRQRQQALDLGRRGRRLHLAGRAHRPRAPRHKGISLLIVDAHGRPASRTR
jgi:alkylation response protein AidB-like acyl-CoA dehydrogenase